MPHDYCSTAVQREIDRHNRRARRGRVCKREGRLIHALLSCRSIREGVPV